SPRVDASACRRSSVRLRTPRCTTLSAARNTDTAERAATTSPNVRILLRNFTRAPQAGRSIGRVEPVADADHRLDQILGRLAPLASQRPNVNVDGARLAEVVVSPDTLQDLLPTEHAAAALDEHGQQIELLPRQAQLPPLHLRHPPLRVQVEQTIRVDA